MDARVTRPGPRPVPRAGAAPQVAQRRVPPRRRAAPPRLGDPRRRHGIAATLSLLLLCVFAGRLIQIQAIDGPGLAQQALESRLVTSEISVPRADIVDRDGVVLATSVDRYNVVVNQQALATWRRTSGGQTVAAGPAGAAAILAPILGVDEASLEAALTGDKRFAYVARDVDLATWERIAAERVGGIDKEKTSVRVYPNGTVAGNVVGFVGGRDDLAGDWGIAGLEYAFEPALLGQAGSLTYERGGGNVVIPTGIQSETAAVPGSTLVTSIDRDLQWYTQDRLDQAVRDTRADWGVVIVMDVATGEVYVLADSSPVDPNDPGASSVRDRGSRAVSAVFEPGSTGKIITMAAALEKGLATPTSQYVAPYEYTTPNGQTFHDSHEHRDMRLTLTGILAQSSNTGTVIVGSGLTPDERYEYLQKFGLGSATGVGLPGESGGILHPANAWDGRTKYAVLFGQGVSVTAMQTAQVYATIANGGVRVQPNVVLGFELPDGTFEPRATAEPVRVVSKDTAAQLMTMLESVVDDGTGTLAQVPGYRIAGKTGTAQAASPDGTMSDVVASFVGVAPADDPRIVVSVMLYNPRTTQWGGSAAGPVFADVTAMALLTLGIPPSGTTPDLYPTTWR